MFATTSEVAAGIPKPVGFSDTRGASLGTLPGQR